MPARRIKKEHDSHTPLDDGRVWGVEVQQGPKGLRSTSVPVILSAQTWTPLRFSLDLGFPLQYFKLEKKPIEDNGLICQKELEKLQLANDKQHSYANKVWTRVDGKDVHPQQCEAYFQYVGEQADPVMLLGSSLKWKYGQDSDEYKEAKKRQMRPEAFHTFFKELRRQKMAQGLDAWENVKSPVWATFGDKEIEPACGVCYAGKRENGKLLQVCKGCERRWYCSEACKLKDRQTHKGVCQKLTEVGGSEENAEPTKVKGSEDLSKSGEVGEPGVEQKAKGNGEDAKDAVPCDQ